MNVIQLKYQTKTFNFKKTNPILMFMLSNDKYSGFFGIITHIHPEATQTHIIVLVQYIRIWLIGLTVGSQWVMRKIRKLL